MPESAAEDTSAAGEESSPTLGSTAAAEESTTPDVGDTTDAAPADYPTHESCEDTGDGYDVPEDDGMEDGSTGSAEETGVGMGDDIPLGATVFTVRQGYVPAGTWVELRDVVISSPVANDEEGSAMVFAQSPKGGMFSGITLVFQEPSVAATLAIGDRVRVTGRVGERYVFTAIFVDLGADAVVHDGAAAVPDPVVLTPEELEPGAPAAEAYESALVRVENPQVERPQSCAGEFIVDAGLGVDDLFLGDAAPNPAAGDTFSAVTGPLRYTYNGFEIAPRSAGDVEP
ncbi:MAG: hypothetical protein IAG13_24015 [Deltaproteobacteria bacterium]|nr:hypothetical protein [Nannocystaceae bacterium]